MQQAADMAGQVGSQILVAVAQEGRRLLYEEFLANEQVTFTIVPTLRELVVQAGKTPHCGILIDVAILVKASTYDKNLSEDTLRALPSARINVSRTGGRISILPMGDNSGVVATASEFVADCCRRPPRIVHVRNRIPLHLNALLSATPELDEPLKTACIDFSEGGCFLFCVDPHFIPHQQVWIRLVGLHDQTPIPATVCWRQEWGESARIPGIGVHFTALSSAQQEEIMRLVAGKKRQG